MKASKIVFCFMALLTIGLVAGGYVCYSDPLYFIIGASGVTLCYVPLVNVDPTRNRAIYERTKLIVAKINLLNPQARIIVSEDYLNSEQVINDDDNQYEFQTWQKAMANTMATKPLQKGLNDNDLGITRGVRMFIDSRVPGTGNVIPQSYPNPFAFAASGATVLDLYAFFNGQWNLTIGRTVYNNWDTTRRFLKIPRTQKSGATNESEWDGNWYNFKDPYPVVGGQDDITLEVKIKKIAGWAGAATEESGLQNVLSMEFDFLIIQNGAAYKAYFTGDESINEALIAKGKATKEQLAAIDQFMY